MRKFLNFETCSRNIKDKLSKYLKEQKIYYELSEAGTGWHFEVLVDDSQAKKVNEFLDRV